MMAQPDANPDVEAFLEFLRKNISYAVVDCVGEPLNSDRAPLMRGFQSIQKIKEYFEQNGSARLRDLLVGIWSPEEPSVEPDDILQNYIAVFCILFELGKGKSIELFSSSNFSDLKLPFDPGLSPSYFSGCMEENFFGDFCHRQWEYCVPEFKYPMKSICFEDQRILPIVDKRFIARGGNASIYKIELHGLYNRLNQQNPTPSDPRDNTYALKTYTTPDAAVYYQDEVKAFRRLKGSQAPSLIGFYGNFVQGHTFNIILEHADKGTLEYYFSKIAPPLTDVHIVNFWEALFQVIWGLQCIHTLHGFHQDIKPANILVCSGGMSGDFSEYSWKFKVADLGLSHFNKVAKGSEGPISPQGTRTYGAPECYRGDGLTERENIKVGQLVDVWSLGCIFSEAATWVASGYQGLKAYRRSRRQAITQIDGDCFHDGQTVLSTVTYHHKVISLLLKADGITEQVLQLVTQDMLKVAAYRSTAQQLWEKSHNILKRGRDHAEQSTPEIPPDRSGFSMRRGPVARQACRSPPHQPPELPPSSLPPSRDPSTIQGGSSSSQFPLMGPDSPRECSPDILPSRMSTDLDGNSPYRSKVSLSRSRIDQAGSPDTLNSTRTRRVSNCHVPRADGANRPRKYTKSKSRSKRNEQKTGKPYLSVTKASLWKAQCHAQKRIIQPGATPKPLPHSYLLERLGNRDYTFLIDDSSSMKAHWEEVIHLVGVLAYIVKPYASNGIEMIYTISSKTVTSKNSSKLVDSLQKTTPNGISDISIRLSSILEQYKSKIREVYGAGSKFSAKAHADLRPLTLYILTDGVWQPKCDAETPIINLVRKVLKYEVPKNQVGIEFIHFGDNGLGRRRVEKLDNMIFIENIATQLDIVDTVPSDRNVWKMLLGSINPHLEDSDNDNDSNDDKYDDSASDSDFDDYYDENKDEDEDADNNYDDYDYDDNDNDNDDYETYHDDDEKRQTISMAKMPRYDS